eukprot:m.36991 g.36991  ORF g.36991 m.36991 type:complete len:322 (-) comp5808_c1_seq1:604-1569(-)
MFCTPRAPRKRPSGWRPFSTSAKRWRATKRLVSFSCHRHRSMPTQSRVKTFSVSVVHFRRPLVGRTSKTSSVHASVPLQSRGKAPLDAYTYACTDPFNFPWLGMFFSPAPLPSFSFLTLSFVCSLLACRPCHAGIVDPHTMQRGRICAVSSARVPPQFCLYVRSPPLLSPKMYNYPSPTACPSMHDVDKTILESNADTRWRQEHGMGVAKLGTRDKKKIEKEAKEANTTVHEELQNPASKAQAKNKQILRRNSRSALSNSTFHTSRCLCKLLGFILAEILHAHPDPFVDPRNSLDVTNEQDIADNLLNVALNLSLKAPDFK